jgi:hypothetical protein
MSPNEMVPPPAKDEPGELARYIVGGAERVLYGQLIDGLVHVTDHPASGVGRTYHVDCCLARDGHAAVTALVADYTRQAARLKEIPMVKSATDRIEQVELGRYQVTAGERVLFGQSVHGVVRVTDRPAEGTGRSYLVELGLECDGYRGLEALVGEYIRQAGLLDAVPMSGSLARRRVRRTGDPLGGQRPARATAAHRLTVAAAVLI